MKIRVLPKFPARVTADDGLAVAVANGTYNFSLDFEALGSGTSIADPDNTYVPVWDEDSDTYSRLTASAFGQALSAGLYGTSTTSLSVSDGTKTLTASVGRAWQATQRLRLSSDDGTKVLSGTVTSYNPISGALVLEADYHLGSSTHADWNISPGGEVGPAGADGAGAGDLSGPAGAVDGVVALFDGATGKLLKEGSGPLGALAYLSTVDLTSLVTGDLPLSNIAQIATDRLLGRDTTGTGDLEAITVGGGLEFTGSGGIQRSALTGAVTASAGSGTTVLADGVVTWPKLAAASLASQGDAETGTATDKFMSPERVAQAIAALAPGGGLTLLDSGTVSSQANLDIVLTSYTSYRGLILKLINLRAATDNVGLRMFFSSNGGSSFDASSSNYAWTGLAGSNSADTKIDLMMGAGNVKDGATNRVHCTIEILGQTAALFTRAKVETWGISASGGGTYFYAAGMGTRLTSQDTDALRINCSSGNITSVDWALYGLL